jgi:hypothetical protein
MPHGKWCVPSLLLYALTIAGCAHTSSDVSVQTRNAREIQVLMDRPTPDRLATASVLEARFEGAAKTDRPLQLVEQAEALAPLRPDLVWLQLGQCRRLQCDAKTQIEDRLKDLDPENGFVWIPNLERAQASGSETAVTEAILRIGNGTRMTFYWNQLEVMVVDGLGVAEPSRSLAVRGVDAVGILSAMAIPPLQPMSKACVRQQLELPRRRAACESMFKRMEQSSTVLTQRLALSVQERWWPAGSAEREALQKQRRRLDYLLAMFCRVRWWRINKDMATRLDAARRTEREEDVELALVRSWGLPTEPPADWKDPYYAG